MKIDIGTLKKTFLSSVETWADSLIDDFVASHTAMLPGASYMKRGVKNYLAKEEEAIGRMIDQASLFICDEQGQIDTDALFDDLLSVFKNMDEVPFGKGALQGTIGKGAVRFRLPENTFVSLLFGNNTQAIKITGEDMLALKAVMSEYLRGK